ncbi:RIP metalloprotease RseP [Spirochaeta isovalerica]|uniref:Zinc metalloprotease n=1 Tax=Spirochaeta isovalerica TaxID=150 RepID=A0A841RD45_9SPIO|nr:RIP metalloprotease RseP [Spirochaeta isovalerica]MBB6481311.1 regulator of sigma E protease [Spirochaeta isovalerica]
MFFTILLGLLALSVVVLVHELGHFAAARLSGIEVEAFSLGWGKAILKKKIGKTEYRLAPLPLGGYCKMKGEHALIEAIEAKEKSIPVEEGAFYSASPLKRIAVALAGPLANFIFAGLVLSVIFLIGYEESTFQNKIILASSYDNTGKVWPANKAGLETGDRIIAINGVETENYNNIAEKLATSARNKLELLVLREGRQIRLILTPELNKDSGAGVAGIYPWIDPVIGEVEEGSKAAQAGLEAGDIIKSINGNPVNNSLDISRIMASEPGKLNISYERRGSINTCEIETDFSLDDFRLGITYKYQIFRTPRYNIFQAIGRGYSEAVDTLVLSAKGLKLLFSGLNLNKAVSGPIRMTYFAGEVAANGFTQGLGQGFLSFFQFVSFISIALFFMNLLPIPALDGGQIVLFIYEIIRKSPLSPNSVYRYQMIGTFLILLLVLLTTTSDILFLAGK